MPVTQLADRFGSNRKHAPEPGRLLRGCKVVNVPFVGGFCEVPFFVPVTFNGEPTHGSANIVNVNDLDRAMMNLGRIVRDRREQLQAALDATLFHPDELAQAQDACRQFEMLAMTDQQPDCKSEEAFDWAYCFFICSWMTRGGSGGTKGEFNLGMSVRYKSTGGDSVVRFRNATEALTEWQNVMRLCTFNVMDAFDFIAECRKRDHAESGIYADPPWIADGKNYKHGAFDDLVNWSDDPGAKLPFERITRHEAMARMLASFQYTRIVVRYGDCEELRRIYPEPLWTWHRIESKTQAGSAKAEVLLTRNIPK